MVFSVGHTSFSGSADDWKDHLNRNAEQKVYNRDEQRNADRSFGSRRAPPEVEKCRDRQDEHSVVDHLHVRLQRVHVAWHEHCERAERSLCEDSNRFGLDLWNQLIYLNEQFSAQQRSLLWTESCDASAPYWVRVENVRDVLPRRWTCKQRTIICWDMAMCFVCAFCIAMKNLEVLNMLASRRPKTEKATAMGISHQTGPYSRIENTCVIREFSQDTRQDTSNYCNIK